MARSTRQIDRAQGTENANRKSYFLYLPCVFVYHTILLCVAMSIVSFLSALGLIFLLSLVSGSAPGDEHDYCVNTVNVDDPPSAREPGRNILLDTYNYAALLTRIGSFTNPVLETFPPVFQRFDVDGSSPTLVSSLPPHTQFRRKYLLYRA